MKGDVERCTNLIDADRGRNDGACNDLQLFKITSDIVLAEHLKAM